MPASLFCATPACPATGTRCADPGRSFSPQPPPRPAQPTPINELFTALAALFASYFPARRAAAVDPAQTLRGQ